MNTSSTKPDSAPPQGDGTPTSSTQSRHANAGSSSSSSSQNKRKNSKKKGSSSGTSISATTAWSGLCSEFNGEIFALKGEYTTTARYKTTVEAAEVVVATMFPKAAKGMSSLFFTNPMTPTIDEPTEPQGSDRQDSFICQKYFRDRDRVIAEKVIIEGALHGLFVLLWGQCSPGI